MLHYRNTRMGSLVVKEVHELSLKASCSSQAQTALRIVAQSRHNHANSQDSSHDYDFATTTTS